MLSSVTIVVQRVLPFGYDGACHMMWSIKGVKSHDALLCMALVGVVSFPTMPTRFLALPHTCVASR